MKPKYCSVIIITVIEYTVDEMVFSATLPQWVLVYGAADRALTRLSGVITPYGQHSSPLHRTPASFHFPVRLFVTGPVYTRALYLTDGLLSIPHAAFAIITLLCAVGLPLFNDVVLQQFRALT